MLIKRITVVCILLSMLVMNIPVFVSAQSHYEFNTAEYSTYSGYMNVDESGKPLPSLGMGNNTSLTYDSVYVEEAGQYNLIFELVGVYGENSTMVVFYDGVEVLQTSLPLTQSYLSVKAGEIPLNAGNNKLTFKVTNTESVYFTRYKLEKVASLTTFVRNGDSADRQSEEGITDNKPSEGMNRGRFAEYDITIHEDGYYALSFEGATVSEVNAEVSLSVDNKKDSVILCGKGWYSPVRISYRTVYLKAGLHTFRLEITSEAIRLFSIVVKGIEENIATEFLAEVSKSDVKTLGSVFKKYDSRLINSYKTLMENIIYKNFCYMRILGTQVSDFAEFDNNAMSFISEEIETPLVSVLFEGEKVHSLPSGNFDVVFSDKFKENFSVAVTLFNKEKNQLKSVKFMTIIPGEENILQNLYANGNEDLRIFFWEKENDLTPGKLPVNDRYIYVSPSGNDSAEGTFERPIKSMEEAVVRVNTYNDGGNVTVNFLPGEYFITETISLDETDGGIEENTVTYKSFDKNNPAVISGGKRITGWEPYQNGIYMAQTEGIYDVRQFYVNGFPANRARGKSVFYASSYWDNEETDYAEDGFVVENSSFPNLIKPQDAEICYNILWTIQRLPVSDVTENNGSFTVKMDQPYYSEAVTMLCDGGVQPVIGMQLFVENDLSLLDEAGEFYFDKDNNVIYYYPFTEENLEEAECVISVTEKLFEIKGSSEDNKVKNISFENLDFRYGAHIDANITGTVSFQAECLAVRELGVNPAHADVENRLPGQIEVKNAKNIRFKNCDISCMGSSAISFGDSVENSAVTGCFFRDNGGSAISVGNYNYTSETSPDFIAKNIEIENNVITRPGIDFMFCPAITVYYSKGVQILHNTITNTPYSGVSLGWGWGSTVSESVECQDHIIKGNRIENISNAVRDGGHIYLLGGLNNTLVSENFISGSDDFGGIYFDSGSKGITATNNVAEKCKNWLFGGGSSSDVLVKENYTDGSGMSFETNAENNVSAEPPAVYENSLWNGIALEIYENSGAMTERKFENEELPEWRNSSQFNVPRTEELKEGEILIEAEDYTGFTTNSNKEKPTLNLQGYRTVIGDIRQFDVMEYDIDVIKEGDYMFELRYTTGPYTDQNLPVSISVMVDGETVLQNSVLPSTNTKWASAIPYKVGVIHLKEGKNKVSIKNLRNGFSYDNFKLIKQ